MRSYKLLKQLIYTFETMLGLLFLYLANGLFREGSLTGWLAGLVLLGTGMACCVFGVVTFRLREDPDIWR